MKNPLMSIIGMCRYLEKLNQIEATHGSWNSPCKVGFIPGWLMVLFYIFLPIIVPLIPFIYGCKYWCFGDNRNDECSKLFWMDSHSMQQQRDQRDHSDPDPITKCCQTIFMVFMLIFLVLLWCFAIFAIILIPCFYFFLLDYHCQKCEMEQTEKRVFFEA